MEFTDEELDEFRRIYAEEFHEQISKEEARAMASRLLRLYEIFARPLPGEQPPQLDPPHPSKVG